MKKTLFRLWLIFSALFAATACSSMAAPAETVAHTPTVAAVSAPSANTQPDDEDKAAAEAASAETDHTDDHNSQVSAQTLKPSEELRRIWDNIRRDDDVTVLPAPPTPQPTPVPEAEKPEKVAKPTVKPEKDKTNKAEKNPTGKNNKPKVNVQLRKPPATPPRSSSSKGKAKTVPAPAVKMPPAKTAPSAPALTRRQILEREINRERAALRAAQSQLNAARKKGNTHQVNRLMGIIKDRELNIKAISKEMVK